MIHSSRRDRKTKAIAEALAMLADAHPELVPHRPRPVRETDEWLWESATEFCASLDRYAGRAMEIKRENRRPPSVPAARPAPCCTNPTPAIYLSSRRDFVEVLTECRDQHLERAEVRFVAVGVRRNRTMGSALARYVAFRSNPWQACHRKPNPVGGFPHVCCAVNNRSHDNGVARFPP